MLWYITFCISQLLGVPPMMNFKLAQFKTTFVVTASAIVFIFLYLAYSSWSFQVEYLEEQSEELLNFAGRATSRIEANPGRYLGDNATRLSSERFKLQMNKAELLATLPSGTTLESLTPEQANAIVLAFNGLFSVSDILLIYPALVADQQVAYVYTDVSYNDELLNTHLREVLQPAILVSVVLISILLMVQLMQINNVGKVVNELADWADALSTTKKFQPPPKLAARGINYLAHTMSSSLNTFSEILEKEHSFARFSSHELRTQVAVLSVNMETLEVIMKDLSPDERKVLNRMLIAIEDMKYQTEALLWLSKATEQELQFSQCNIVDIANKAVQTNMHILEGKDVQVTCSGEDLMLLTHETLLQIAVNNLVRNAFQNTSKGYVNIHIGEDRFTIENKNTDAVDGANNLEGFGIGLVLVQRIVEKINLVYTVENFDNGRRVELTLAQDQLVSRLEMDYD